MSVEAVLDDLEPFAVVQGDCRETLGGVPDGSVQCIVTSPPYWAVRDYRTPALVWGGDAACTHTWGEALPPAKRGPGNVGVSLSSGLTNPKYHAEKPCKIFDGGSFCACGAWRGHLGLEPSVELYVEHIVGLCEELRRVLRDDGLLFLNLGDTFAARSLGPNAGTTFDPKFEGREYPPGRPNRSPQAGLKPKDKVMLPHRVAIALQEAGWWVRMDIVWSKKNPMPESCEDRPTVSHEYVFLLAKSGAATFWVHRDGRGARVQPEPDYVFRDRASGTEQREEPGGWKEERLENGRRRWQRVNLWESHDYFYDGDAIAEPASGTAHPRGSGVTPKGKLWPGIGPKHGGERERGEEYEPMRQRPRQNNDFQAATSAELVPTRNKRSVWHLRTEATSEAHFATYPTALVEPCIRAGSSAGGACAACGAPRVRVTREAYHVQRSPGPWVERMQDERGGDRSPALTEVGAASKVVQTLGWQPSCACPTKETVPCLVLDPFAGSGTTGLVALREGRRFLGCELSEEYVGIALRRLAAWQGQTRLVTPSGLARWGGEA